jgi:hypothetical protein
VNVPDGVSGIDVLSARGAIAGCGESGVFVVNISAREGRFARPWQIKKSRIALCMAAGGRSKIARGGMPIAFRYRVHVSIA